VVAYDKPGCGLSDPWPAPQTLDSDLEVLRAVIDHLELGRVDLLGLSMGYRCRWPTPSSARKGSDD
jgi:pimeloyl-ACP methyl ester carboxylesterase